ncbi:MAG: AbrB/MazE/SpoVT family DNA-binding domain-containing protein [Acidobacteria bacterium]|nr:AbrB/MazE/SpoVT family DNA-binding domain-containing protein [Acidobacteriota bacterium]
MTYTSVLSTKGQVTIPQEIRLRLGLKEGDRIEFVAEGEHTIIRPARSEKNPFDAYIGALGGFRSRKEVNAWLRNLRGHEDSEEDR